MNTTYIINNTGTHEVSPTPQFTANQFLQRLIQNQWLGRSRYNKTNKGGQKDRDLYAACGYPSEIGPEDYKDLYERNSVATRVVEVLPAETWKTNPIIFENGKESFTQFEDDLQAISQVLSEGSKFKSDTTNILWGYLARADKVTGIGHFGVLFLGLNDGGILREDPMKGSSNLELKYLRVFDESQVRISRWEEDTNSPRYGKPVIYELDFEVPTGVNTDSSVVTHSVHWKRVIHLVDTLGTSEVFAIPRMRPVFNRLIGCDILFGASQEGYWNGAINMYAFSSHPQLGPIDIDVEDISQEMDEMLAGLRRIATASGGEIKSLLPAVVDPSPYIDKHVEAICIYLGIPKRKFMGSERGDLASTQDEGDWKDTLSFRQDRIVTPNMIVPTVDRLIMLGVVTEPSEYGIRWDELDPMTRMERGQYAKLVVESLAKFVGGDVQEIMHEKDFYAKILGITSEEVEAILQNIDPPDNTDDLEHVLAQDDDELVEEPQEIITDNGLATIS